MMMRRWAAVLATFVLLSPALGQDPAGRKTPAAARNACGPASDGWLKCPRFGFSYKIPFGWVERTNEMQKEAEAEAGNPEAGATDSPLPTASRPAKPETLLAIFERPPGAPGETIDSAVVIAAEPLANYHGVKQASDYFGPITELAEQRGFKVVNEPYLFSSGAKKLVRGDFSKPRGNLTMWQSSLVMIEKGYIVSFTFIGGDEDEVGELIGSLKFGASAQHKQGPHR